MKTTSSNSIRAFLLDKAMPSSASLESANTLQGTSVGNKSQKAARYCASQLAWLGKSISSLEPSEHSLDCSEKGLSRANDLLSSSKGIYTTALRSPQYSATFLTGGRKPSVINKLLPPVVRGVSLQLMVSEAKQRSYVFSSAASTFPYGTSVSLVFDELSENQVKVIADRNIGTSDTQIHFGPGYTFSLEEGQQSLASNIRERGQDVKTAEINKFYTTILGQQVNETVANIGLDNVLMLAFQYNEQGAYRADPEHVFLELSKATSETAAQKLAELKNQSRDTRFSKVNWADVKGTAIFLTTHAKLEDAAQRPLAMTQRNHQDSSAVYEALDFPQELIELAKDSDFDSEYAELIDQADRAVKWQLVGRALKAAVVFKATGYLPE